jgi:putative (di)nucleoside polyphosphate hydrolase
MITDHPERARLLPYRLGVGMMILNSNRKVFVGKRVDAKIEAWQMPQGGIDIGETPSRAAMREMEEEIGSNAGRIIAESKNWYSYDLPKFLIPKLWDGRYKGQKQKWFLIQFTGNDNDINLNTEHPEFEDWRWADLSELHDIIIPFKRKLYQAVIVEFQSFLSQFS